jgi:hypothetical protein
LLVQEKIIIDILHRARNNQIKEGILMETLNRKSISWIYVIVLAVLYLTTLILMGYEHLINPTEPIWMIVTNLALISIPLILLYGSIGLILLALRQKEEKGKINHSLSRFLYYTPRIAGILMILFVALFALDVFTAGGNFWEQLLGFAIHAAPSIVLAILMFFAWRKPVIGFIVFGLVALFFLRFVFGSADFGASNFLMFVAPMALISGLFWINWKWKETLTIGKVVG